MSSFNITATIVTYNHKYSDIEETINCFLNTNLNVFLFIVDNSPVDILSKDINSTRIEYCFLDKNDGFGAGHNIILNKINKLGKYHIVLNPDIEFKANQLELMLKFMDENLDVGLLMPKVFYPDGTTQYLCKLLPTPRDWIFRRFLSFLPSTKKRDDIFELRFTKYKDIMEVPYLSGSFMFLRSSIIPEIGVFDEGIFMYGEDTDLSRRIHQKHKTIFFPRATVIHHFQKESHKDSKLLWIHIKAAIYYFNKWGWFSDKERDIINSRILKKLNYEK